MSIKNDFLGIVCVLIMNLLYGHKRVILFVVLFDRYDKNYMLMVKNIHITAFAPFHQVLVINCCCSLFLSGPPCRRRSLLCTLNGPTTFTFSLSFFV